MNPIEYGDDFEMTELPQSFLAHLQPAGAFLQQHQEHQHQHHALSHSLQSPTALAQRQAAPEITPLAFNSRVAAPVMKSLNKSASNGAVAMSFMSAMRRGLNGLQDSDSEDDDDDEDDDEDDDNESGYYQPAYNQYYAPNNSYTGRASAPALAPAPILAATPKQASAEDDDLIFPMEM